MMMGDRIHAPQIRFSGFSDDWEHRKLGDISEIITGGTPKTTEEKYWNPKEIPWMSSGEINNMRIVKTEDSISKNGFDNSSAKWVNKNSVLIALAGQGKTRGMVAVNEIKLTTNQSIAAIQPNCSLYYEFLFHNLGKRYEELRLISSGDGTRGGLNKKIISELNIFAPSYTEQKNIGILFKQIDLLITLHQCKLDKLINIKKSMLEKMFVEKNTDVPEIRFKGFTDTWEQQKLGETVENLKSGLSRMLSNEDIGIPVIRANNLVFGRVNFNDDIKYWYLQDPKGADTSNYLVHKGDILINFINSESKMGTASYVDAEPIRPTIYTTNILKLSVNNKYYSKFIFYITYTKRYINYVKSITKPAVNQASFTTVEYKKFSLSIPKYEEQKRIGQFFEKLDKLITLHQRKLEKLKNIKTSCLEKMFV